MRLPIRLSYRLNLRLSFSEALRGGSLAEEYNVAGFIGLILAKEYVLVFLFV